MVITCDTKLEELFGCKSLSVTGVTDKLANHLPKKS